MILDILLAIALVGLIIGTYTDWKVREVPDWVSYSMIVTGLGLRLLYSAITFDWMFFVYGLAGFGIFLGLAFIMFYAGQWGGGDAKVLMGLGALIGFNFTPFSFFISFLINLLLIGALYGIVWSIYLAVKNRKRFAEEFKKNLGKQRKVKIFLIIFLILLVLSSLFVPDIKSKILVLVLAVFLYFSFYIFVFVKAVEKSSMFKMYKINRLTEGDWIAKVIKHKGKYICGPKDLGITKKQIALLKKYNVKEVLVKEGIPFIPSFLIAFVVTLILFLLNKIPNLMFLIVCLIEQLLNNL